MNEETNRKPMDHNIEIQGQQKKNLLCVKLIVKYGSEKQDETSEKINSNQQ